MNKEKYTPLLTLDELDLMIFNGWGDTPQNKIPEDWRTQINPFKFGDKEMFKREERLPSKRRRGKRIKVIDTK